MLRTVRRVLILLAGTVGIAVATAAPAFAGINLSNHTEPFSRWGPCAAMALAERPWALS